MCITKQNLPTLIQPQNPKRCSASFEFFAPLAREVFIVGEFNDWNSRATPMQRSGDGNWHIGLMLKPGFYHYKFVVDSTWRCHPDQPVDRCDFPCERCERCVPNVYGSFDRVAVVA